MDAVEAKHLRADDKVKVADDTAGTVTQVHCYGIMIDWEGSVYTSLTQMGNISLVKD